MTKEKRNPTESYMYFVNVKRSEGPSCVPVSFCLPAVVPISSHCLNVFQSLCDLFAVQRNMNHMGLLIHACSWLHDAQNMVLQAKR